MFGNMTEKNTKSMPAVPTHLRDYNNEHFDHVWLIYGKGDDMYFPYVAFISETKAREHINFMSDNEWALSDTEFKSIELQLKKIRV